MMVTIQINKKSQRELCVCVCNQIYLDPGYADVGWEIVLCTVFNWRKKPTDE